MTMTLGSGQVAMLFLVLLRATGFVVAAPLFGHRVVPPPVKAGMAAALAIVLANGATAAPGALPILIAAPLELAIGLILGFLVNLGFAAVEIVGRLISLQMGLSLASVFSPTEEQGATALDPLFSVLAGLLFLALGLHLAIVQTLGHSLLTFPVGGGWSPQLPELGAQLTAIALELGVRVGMPLALVLLLAQLGVALLSRAIPQINVFIFGLPLQLLVGIVVTAAAMPSLARGATSIFQALIRSTSSGVLP
jgi:flagellar biosynthetic protein FliR